MIQNCKKSCRLCGPGTLNIQNTAKEGDIIKRIEHNKILLKVFKSAIAPNHSKKKKQWEVIKHVIINI